MEEIAKTIASLGLPPIALIFGIVFIIVFRSPISAFIGRIRIVGKGGVSTDSSPEAQHDKQRKKAVEDLMNVGDSIVIKELEGLIITDLSDRGLETEGDSIKVLVKHLAVYQLELDFEQIHSLILGSQVSLLKRLNEVAGLGKPKEFMDDYVSNVQYMFEELRAWTLDKYLKFMFERTLITIQNGNYHITNKGLDFLTWMARTGHKEDRGF